MASKYYGNHVYNDGQVAVAQQTWKIIRQQFGFWERPATAAIACQIVESSLLGPIGYGDQPGYLGAYQQSDKWVPTAVLNKDQDPRKSLAGSTFLFLYGGYAAGQPGLFSFDWVNTPIGTLVQQVQDSNTPDAYNKVLPDATALLNYVKTLP